jgi:DNA-binding MarR family transcriptional regulator
MPTHKTISPLEAHLGFWLRFVSNHVSQAFSRRLAAHDVSVAEWVILRELVEEGSAQPSELAERLGMTRGAISKLADRLEAKALASRRTDKDDRRYQALRISAKGRALVPVLAALADENDAEFFGHLEREAREQVVTVMQEIVRRHGLRAAPVD